MKPEKGFEQDEKNIYQYWQETVEPFFNQEIEGELKRQAQFNREKEIAPNVLALLFTDPGPLVKPFEPEFLEQIPADLMTTYLDWVVTKINEKQLDPLKAKDLENNLVKAIADDFSPESILAYCQYFNLKPETMAKAFWKAMKEQFIHDDPDDQTLNKLFHYHRAIGLGELSLEDENLVKLVARWADNYFEDDLDLEETLAKPLGELKPKPFSSKSRQRCLKIHQQLENWGYDPVDFVHQQCLQKHLCLMLEQCWLEIQKDEGRSR